MALKYVNLLAPESSVTNSALIKLKLMCNSLCRLVVDTLGMIGVDLFNIDQYQWERAGRLATDQWQFKNPLSGPHPSLLDNVI